MTPFKLWKLYNRSTYSLTGHRFTLRWIIQTLFSSKSSTVTACRVKTEGEQTSLLNSNWSPMSWKWNTNTLIPMYALIIPWCQWKQPLRALIYIGSHDKRNWQWKEVVWEKEILSKEDRRWESINFAILVNIIFNIE